MQIKTGLPATRALLPLALALAVAGSLPACKKQETTDAPAAAATPEQQAAAPAATSAVAAAVSAMSPEQLRDAASKAYAENRLYAPAANNALEYYLALRDKQPADAGVASALSDLMPMTVIATEQSITREDFTEAKRLAAMIEKAEAQHPALARLKNDIATAEAAVAKRAATQQLTAEEEAKRLADIAKKREEDQKRLQEQQRQQVAPPPPAPAAPSVAQQQQAAAQEDARRQAAAREEEARRQAAAREEEQRRQQAAAAQQAAPAPARASSDLVAVSNPQPRFPQAAQRAGEGATVQVEFTVNTDGSVSGARVVSSTASRQYKREFEREAMAAVNRWRFQPIGSATTTRRTVTFAAQ